MNTLCNKYLIFSLQDRLYALDLAQVAEVGDPAPPLSPLPLAPACYCGVLSFHGDIVAVMDLARFFGTVTNGKPGKIVILDPSVASLALLVDSINRIISGADVLSVSPDDQAYTASKLRFSGGEALLLDLDTIVRDAETGMREYCEPSEKSRPPEK